MSMAHACSSRKRLPDLDRAAVTEGIEVDAAAAEDQAPTLSRITSAVVFHHGRRRRLKVSLAAGSRCSCRHGTKRR
ncbi:hypothetical protein VPH35_073202 [Triticum aestivum]